MTTQADHAHDPRIPAIPHTINAIGEALHPEKRARFYGEVLAAEEGEPITSVLRRWWKIAMLDRVPGAERSRANAAAGRNLLSIEEISAEING